MKVSVVTAWYQAGERVDSVTLTVPMGDQMKYLVDGDGDLTATDVSGRKEFIPARTLVRVSIGEPVER